MKRHLKWILMILSLIMACLLSVSLVDDKDRFIVIAILLFSVVIYYIVFNTRYKCKKNCR